MLIGVIISANWLLTAAQCKLIEKVFWNRVSNIVFFFISKKGTFGNTAAKLKVRVGSNQYSKGGNLHQISVVHTHPEYNQVVSGDYDIALLKVYTPIVLVKNVKEAIKLPAAGNGIIPATMTSISGWGKRNASAAAYAPKLRVAFISTQSQLDCTWSYCKKQEITARMVCAGKPGIDACAVSFLLY